MCSNISDFDPEFVISASLYRIYQASDQKEIWILLHPNVHTFLYTIADRKFKFWKFGLSIKLDKIHLLKVRMDAFNYPTSILVVKFLYINLIMLHTYTLWHMHTLTHARSHARTHTQRSFDMNAECHSGTCFYIYMFWYSKRKQFLSLAFLCL